MSALRRDLVSRALGPRTRDRREGLWIPRAVRRGPRRWLRHGPEGGSAELAAKRQHQSGSERVICGALQS
ncbi:hypothetical protein GUJ93_ZPchr0003g17693 [Zizania palustris]|uniref:Uncharacterized protein n=1 Tax=Zizania palustris TaxID=103762 RepID=A0A8J5V5L1_ZIZPA|nr:hypothetical protein GUJ93_ZPchr0003g17693 [Zizania palustris]